jgi:16S rRNA (guanine527-N7)-methyltransferase
VEQPAGSPSPPDARAVALRLRAPLEELGLGIRETEAELLARYLALLLPWNLRVNLTGARSADEILGRHLADTFALVPHLPAGPFRLVDVGAGAGFLGVGVAVLRPEAHCVLLEPIGKKHTFLRAVARELPLPNLEPRAERLEAHLASPEFVPFDVAVSRATWSPLEWLKRARPLLRPGGLAAAYEGRGAGPLPAGARRVAFRVGPRTGGLLLDGGAENGSPGQEALTRR